MDSTQTHILGGLVIDSHTHLHLVPGAPATVVETARAARVHRMLTVGTDRARSTTAVSHARRFAGTVFAAVGVHPSSSTGFDEQRDGAWIAELAAKPECRAIGETGFDFFRDRASRPDQERAFRTQAAISRRVGKPLVIHTREADDATLGLLAEMAQEPGDHPLRVIMHCFSMADRADECLDRGYVLSFAGNVTYPGNAMLAAAAVRVPLDRLLVETDAPYLTPQIVRKHRNQPAFVVHTAEFLAEQRGISYGRFEAAVDRTAAGVFGW